METTAELDKGARKSKVTSYFATLFHTGASLVLAVLAPTIIRLSRDVASEHAPGLTAVAASLLESFFSLRSGIFFLVFFSAFYLARQSSKPAIRIALFWIPTSLVTALGLAVWVWIAAMMLMIARS